LGLVTALVVLPGVVAVVRMLGSPWYPTGDMAQAELHLRGFWAHPPLVGAAGRIYSDAGVQGSHPGPSLWMAMYPVYQLLGRSSAGLMVAVLSVHVVAIGVALYLAHQIGGRALSMATAVALALVVRAGGPAVFIEPWNPWLAVFPFAVFLLAVTASVVRSPWWLVVATAAGIHCIHSHAGYLVLVAGLLTAAAVVLLAQAGRAHRWRSALVPLGTCAGVAFAMWLPPLVDQVVRQPGNLEILYQHFGSPSEPFIALSMAARIIASELSIAGPWVTGPALVERNAAGVVVTALVWAAAIWVAVRRRMIEARWLHATLGLTAVLGAMSVRRIFGSYQEYTIRWFWVLTALIVAASAWSIWHWLTPARRAQLRPVMAAVSTLTLCAVTVVASAQFASRARHAGEDDSRLVGALHRSVEDALDRGGRYLVRWHDPVGLGAVPFGLVLELERDGYQPGVDPAFAAAALPHRVLPEADADGLVWVVLGSRIEDFRADPAFTEVAFADLRTDRERARYDELYAFLARRFSEIGRSDLIGALDAQYGTAGLLFIEPPLPPDIAEAVSELVGLRLAAAVFIAPPSTPEPPS
jgi:hypothetical protein